MTPAEFYVNILAPSAAGLPMILNKPEAQCLMLAIAGQESAWKDRIQAPGGQARGFWQMERGGMLVGVMGGTYASTLDKVLSNHSIASDLDTIFEAIAWHDPLAYAVGRIGLFMDPSSLPAIGDEDGSWDVYLRVWRPGKPSRARWMSVYPQSVKVMQP